MPRHLDAVLDRLVEIEPMLVHVSMAEAVPELDAYLLHMADWYTLGLPLAVTQRRRIRALWYRQRELRPHLESLITSYPCSDFESAFVDIARQDLHGRFGAWFSWAPRIHAMLRPYAIERAMQTNDEAIAADAGLAWARYYDGSEQAYRAIAMAVHRGDRRRAASGIIEPSAIRQDLEARVSIEEAYAIDRYLAAFGASPLQLQRVVSWWRTPTLRRRELANGIAYKVIYARAASRAFAKHRWDGSDETLYHAAWRRLGLHGAVPEAPRLRA